ncbi:replication protein RepA [Couchioplanes azureus]|uniref:replication protein RepA n=1 Tax=Couchioplanes caeruleus TaxID=56438 RepID=UPI00166FBF48|nr:replication protein RepA [Couchioplanes caeruleus]GGQ85967.1 plasmid replication protein [Couchioplanes caeruleus subsp. azureus]
MRARLGARRTPFPVPILCGTLRRMSRPRRTEADLRRSAIDLLSAERSERDVHYLARVFAQIGLPYKDPDKPSNVAGENPREPLKGWGRSNGNLTLLIQPGVYIDPSGVSVSRGFPFGSTPRLLLAWMSTEVVRTRGPELILGDSLSAFMRNLGLRPTGGKTGTIARLRDQMERLFNATFVVNWNGTGVSGAVRVPVSSQYQLFWTDEGASRRESVFPSKVILSDTFFQEIADHAVPLDVHALKELRGSPLRLDMYAWLTYRMFGLGRPTTIPWESIQGQFGSGYASSPQGRSKFKKDFEKHLARVLLVYPDADVTLTPAGVVLRPSPTSVPTRLARTIGALDDLRTGSRGW